MLSEPIQVTLKVITAFEALGISYLIGGSLASTVYGMIRTTLDSDLVADIKPAQVMSLVALLKSEFFIDEGMILDAIQHTSSFNLIHLESLFKVDVFIPKRRPFDINQMERRILHAVGDEPGESAYFSTAEDIILAKLEWFRAGRETSERQWRDIMGVLELQGDQLDFKYMHKWAASLGVQDLLQRAVRET